MSRVKRVDQVGEDSQVVVIGGGPAGIATAIAARQRGFFTTVLDSRIPPIDKACGEGLLPHGVTSLESLGIRLNSEIAVPFLGIGFSDGRSIARAEFPAASAFAMRRTQLHQLLVDRATQAGVAFHWGARVTRFDAYYVAAGDKVFPYTWLVGADGHNSAVRKWANLGPPRMHQPRFGFRQHFRVRSWPNYVHVYWGRDCQVLTTPVAANEVCVSVLSRDSRLRLRHALPLFPELAEKLRYATSTTRELGDMTSLTRLRAVARGRVALVGDASGTVDAITGHGLSLAFQQSIVLAEAFRRGTLHTYEAAHRKIAAMPAVMTRLMLLMDRNAWVRARTLRLFEVNPKLFAKLLAIHSGDAPLSDVGMGEIVDFGWKLLLAS